MSEHLIKDWAEVTPSIFDGVGLDDREAVNARSKEFFDTHKASREDIPQKVLRSAYNSALHNAIGHASREAKREASAKQRVAEKSTAKETKGALKQHIRKQAKAKANASLLTDAVLAQLTELGVDLSPLEALNDTP